MSAPVATIYVLTLLWTVVTGAAVVLVAMGVRGRQVDRLGRCRACGYVIAGSRGSLTCPECGTDVQRTGLRFGQRRVLVTPLVFGLMLLAVGLTPIAVLMAQQPRAVAAAVRQQAAPTAAPAMVLPEAAGSTRVADDVSDAEPSPRRAVDLAPWQAGEPGLLDEVGTGHGPPMLLPGDVLAGVPIESTGRNVSRSAVADARPRAEQDNASTPVVARETRTPPADHDWASSGLIGAWQFDNPEPDFSAGLNFAFDPPRQPASPFRNIAAGFEPMAWRVEPVDTAAAELWPMRSADPARPVRTRAESTAVKPQRADSGRR